MVDGEMGAILIVEDELVTARLQQRRLERAGHRVVVAASANEAMRQITRALPDLLLLDQHLSDDVTGLEFYSQLKAAGYAFPVIMVTGSDRGATAIEAVRLGVRDFVPKSAAYLDYLPEAVARVLKQVRTEHQLEKSESLLSALVACARDGIVTIDADGRVMFLNAAAEEIFGHNTGALRGQSIQSVIPDLHDLLVRQQAADPLCLATKPCELRGMRANGEIFPLEASISSGDVAGQKFQMFIVRDVTQRKRSEEELQKKEEMLRQAQKLEAIGALTGGIAHEFNNLLQAIRGYAQFASEPAQPESHRQSDLQQVMKATDRAVELIRQLLSFGRRQVLQRANVNANDVVAELLKMLRPLIGADVEIEVILGDDLGTLCADRGQLQQILLNLCINARDAMPDGGRLVIQTENFEASHVFSKLHPEVRPGRHVVLTVADTGHGMSREVREHLFEPFYTTKGIGRGTGLGLATVYGLVQQHEGAIYVDSEPEHGSVFKIYFPASDQFATVIPNQEQRPGPGGSETILIAEDEDAVRNLIARVLEKAGYTTITAVDGEDALRVLETSSHVSLAILDAIMPKLNGRAVYDQIKVLMPGVPVVFCSGYAPDLDQAELAQDDQTYLIQKPFEPRVILHTVRMALDRSRLRNNVALASFTAE